MNSSSVLREAILAKGRDEPAIGFGVVAVLAWADFARQL